ncbi:hypothetical protein KY326_01665 [Candidatus Woesearchaeota archaeon]|nr:hypothetical protein [Candidatus Woesearchaeota archaeon]
MTKMTDKMPKELEDAFLRILKYIQKERNCYWVQTKWISQAVFGAALSEKEFKTNKTRVHRLGQRLKEKGLVQETTRREQVGKSTGKSLVKYYHAELNSVYEDLKRRVRK